MQMDGVKEVGVMSNPNALAGPGMDMGKNQFRTYIYYLVLDDGISKVGAVKAAQQRASDALEGISGVEAVLSESGAGDMSAMMGSGLAIDLYGQDWNTLHGIAEEVKTLVAQFQSLLSPFIILFTIPLAFTGGLAGLGKWEALAAGTTRMRPILMTTLTTVLAMSTMMFSQYISASMSRGMAVVVSGGLLYATLMPLFVVPVMYDLLYRKQPRVVDVGDDLDAVPDDAAEYLKQHPAEE